MDLFGKTFGRLKVVSYAGVNSWRKARWLCQCSCGTETVVEAAQLRRGRSGSCGCLRRETAGTYRRTGFRSPSIVNTPEYLAYYGMRARCEKPSKRDYKNYGGRGIYVCERWREGDGVLSGIACFLADMGRRPSATHSLDRIDNEGPYAPSNCRWATRSQQRQNQRPRKKRSNPP